MKIKKVWAVYFSATGTTEKVVLALADRIAAKLNLERENYNFTLPKARDVETKFTDSDLVIFGNPVYAGRVPNVLLKYFDKIAGDSSLAVPVVVYGNRDYDDGLIELRDLLEAKGMHTIAAAAFIGEHSFSRILGKARPDEQDMQKVEAFADQIISKIASQADIKHPIEVEGIPKPYRGYYQPRDRNGNPVDIRKVQPKTSDACNDCMLCAELCPMGSISFDDVRKFVGICIKCGSCTKNCPLQARYYDDERYIYHQVELEEGFARRAEPSIFI